MAITLLVVAALPAVGFKGTECGAYCLYTAMVAVGAAESTSFSQVRASLGEPSKSGYSLAQLAQVARDHRLHAMGVRTNVENLARRKRPFACIAAVDGNHFVLLGSIGPTTVHVVDPPSAYPLSHEELKKRWDGTALLVSRSELEPEEEINSRGHWPHVTMALLLIAAGTLIGFTWWRSAVRGDGS